MKKFLKYFVIFSFPIIFSSLFAERYFSFKLKQSNGFAKGEFPVWNDIFAGKIESDIVVYGSSRALKHIDPTMISDSLSTTVYNLGIEGHNFWLQYLRHKLLLKLNRKPKLIIQTLDCITLVKKEELYNPDQFLPYMLSCPEIKDATFSYKGYTAADYKIPLLRYYGKKDAIAYVVENTLHPTTTIARVRGFRSINQSWTNDLDKAKLYMESFTAQVDTPSLRLFDKYLQECKNKNINVMLVYSPEYIDGQKFIKNRKEIIKIYKFFSKKYHVPLYDFSNDSLCFSKEYFYNAQHLNAKGATLFTNEVIRVIRENKY